MTRLVVFVAGNILALFLASRYIEGVTISGGWKELLVVGLIFSFFNFVIKPVLKLILGPLILLTLGVLILAINAGMVWLTDIFSDQFTVSGLKPLILAALLLWAVNIVTHIFFRK